MSVESTPLSVNQLAMPLVRRLIDHADRLGVAVRTLPSGVTLVDAGIEVSGSVKAGLLIADICLGGLGRTRTVPCAQSGWPTSLTVSSPQPVLACLGSQYAGWSLAASAEETGAKKFFALGSGPARALAAREPLFADLGYRDRAEQGVIVMEVDCEPPQVVLDKVLRDTGLAPQGLTVILTPTRSLAGSTQVVARVIEVALHKAHELGFDLAHVMDAAGTAPLPAPIADAVQAMGRTNDAILYGGQVHLVVRGNAEAARDLARRLPSRQSRSHGKGFAEIFKEAGYDFYQIDPMLFAPAEVFVSHVESGETFHAGGLDMALLMSLWRCDA
ncbi:MAG: methenyltetrahydromethanopterin cyclohydrolase [Proteobacteria bacterium]|nr:methenyltetrahydromethanopterin cyclohydrolase [Pseudomonadota bacterium]